MEFFGGDEGVGEVDVLAALSVHTKLLYTEFYK
jgi:hypothetical protein